MKKSLLLLTTAALFVACAEKTSLNEVGDTPIDFTKSYVEKTTKAINKGLYTTQNFEATGNTMGVFGWRKKSTTYSIVFDNKSVDYNVTVSGDWGYSPKRYWDSDADNYAFFAYAPHSSDFPNGGTVAMATAGDGNTFSITGFSQATTVANQVDLLVDLTSQVANTTNKAATKTDVAFTFSHILTQVNIWMGVSANLKADNTDNPVTVQSVTLNGAYINGTYSYSNSAWGWSSRSTTQQFAATPSTDTFFNSDHLTATAEVVPGLNQMLLIPGSVTGYTITVNYTIGTGNSPEAYTKTINLTDFKSGNNTLDTWAIGANYNYVLTIGPEPIEFDLSQTGIIDWSTGGTYEYTIE